MSTFRNLQQLNIEWKFRNDSAETASASLSRAMHAAVNASKSSNVTSPAQATQSLSSVVIDLESAQSQPTSSTNAQAVSKPSQTQANKATPLPNQGRAIPVTPSLSSETTESSAQVRSIDIGADQERKVGARGSATHALLQEIMTKAAVSFSDFKHLLRIVKRDGKRYGCILCNFAADNFVSLKKHMKDHQTLPLHQWSCSIPGCKWVLKSISQLITSGLCVLARIGADRVFF